MAARQRGTGRGPQALAHHDETVPVADVEHALDLAVFPLRGHCNCKPVAAGLSRTARCSCKPSLTAGMLHIRLPDSGVSRFSGAATPAAAAAAASTPPAGLSDAPLLCPQLPSAEPQTEHPAAPPAPPAAAPAAAAGTSQPHRGIQARLARSSTIPAEQRRPGMGHAWAAVCGCVCVRVCK